MDKIKAKDKKGFFKEWLEQLQQESWQLELLISGLALFGIWESKELLSSFSNYVDNNVYGGVSDQITFGLLIILKVGWRIFFINLLIHVILRGLWIGSIGLRYISGEIEYENLNYSEVITDFLRKRIGTYDDFIEKLEWICSVLFAYTFLLFLLFLSMTFFFGALPIFFEITGIGTDNGGMSVGIFAMLYYILGFLVFIDFVALGAFKKIKDKTVSRIYLYLFRFYSVVTLSFLYRPLLYNFLDNKSTRRLFFLSIPYILILALAPNSFSNNNYPYFDSVDSLRSHGQIVNDANYEDLRNKKNESITGTAQSEFKYNIPDVILGQFYSDKPYQSLFLKMRQSDQKLFEQDSIIHPIFKEGFRFSLFSSSRSDDPNLASLIDERDETANLIREKIKDNRNQQLGLKEGDEMFKHLNDERERLRIQRDSIVNSKADVREAFSQNKNNDILETFRSYFDIEVDGTPYNDSLICHYYIHPDIGTKGLLCHFGTTNLAKGSHEISVKRRVYRSPKSKRKQILTQILPFIKLN